MLEWKIQSILMGREKINHAAVYLGIIYTQDIAVELVSPQTIYMCIACSTSVNVMVGI